MGELAALVGELLSQLHRVAGPAVCPGDWIWTITAAGLALAVPAVLGASLVALVRRFTGNRYGSGTVVLFTLLGVLGTAVLPLLGFAGAASAVHRAVLGTGASGLTSQDVADLEDAYCFLPPQISYLGGGRSVSEALSALPGPDLLLAGRAVVLLVALPWLALLLTWVLARLAVRRGPAWPARLLWLPLPGVVLGTVALDLDEGVVSQLWVGYTLGIVPGLILVLLIGRPRWEVIHQTGAAPQPPPARLPSARPAAVADPDPMTPVPGGTRATRAAPGPRGGRASGGRFRRLHRLGEGGFGDVWLAVDTALDREVAIKVARVPDSDTEQRIRREARALAAVHHPHCVRVYDILSDVDGLPGLAIVMEYVRGPSLAQQVQQQGPLSDTEGAHLWYTLASALDAAHGCGVLHRDVKPSNIIIDHTRQAHLIDFGIARTTGDPALTATGMVIGTPDYLSPEVAAGAHANPRSDSWQLAATVSYALCGQPPRGFRESSLDALRAAATRQPATELPARSAHAGLLERALHPEPERRPTLADVQAGLTAWLARSGRPAHGPVTRVLAVPPEV